MLNLNPQVTQKDSNSFQNAESESIKFCLKVSQIKGFNWLGLTFIEFLPTNDTTLPSDLCCSQRLVRR